MVENENDASSSSEDEINAADLREACDDNFLTDSLFTKKGSPVGLDDRQSEIIEEVKPSLRITDRSDAFETFGVSQSFKDFVAKKLDDKLERSIELDDRGNSDEESPKKKRKKNKKKKKLDVNFEAGIKLLSNSHETIINFEAPENTGLKQTSKPWKFSKASETENVLKCRDVAVDPDWILSKTETKAWSERQRGNVFEYKKACDGVLTECKPVFKPIKYKPS